MRKTWYIDWHLEKFNEILMNLCGSKKTVSIIGYRYFLSIKKRLKSDKTLYALSVGIRTEKKNLIKLQDSASEEVTIYFFTERELCSEIPEIKCSWKGNSYHKRKTQNGMYVIWCHEKCK